MKKFVDRAYALKHSIATISLFIGLGLLLSACGGGGGSSSPAASQVISGQVTDGSSAGVAGVTITLSGAASATTTTDSSGNYSFSSVANGQYNISASLTGDTFAPAITSLNFTGSNGSGQNFTAAAGTGYTFTAMAYAGNGSPAANVLVSITSGPDTGSAYTDSTGTATFPNAPSGTYAVSASLTGYTMAPGSASVVVSSSPIAAPQFYVVNYALLLTQKSGGDFALSSIPYEANGTAGTQARSTFTIPATAPTTGSNVGCGGSLNAQPSNGYDDWYDAGNHILFLAFIDASSTTTITVCSYKVDMTNGSLTFVDEVVENNASSTGPGFIDQYDHLYMFDDTSAIYSYNSDGSFNHTAMHLSGMANVPGGYHPVDIDVVNHWLWYGTSGSGTTMSGVCPLTYVAGTGYAIGSCTAFGYTITNPTYRDGVDSTNGLYFTASAVAGGCSTTQTVVSVYSYDVSTGVIAQTPTTTNVGACAQVLGSPDASGPNMGNVDFADQMLISWSGTTFNPIPYTLAPFGFSTPPSSKTDSNITIDFAHDAVDHIAFVATGDGSGNVTGLDLYPYTSTGFGSVKSTSFTLTDPAATSAGPVILEFLY